MTETGGGDLDQHLAGTRRVELDLLDRQRLRSIVGRLDAHPVEHGSSYFHFDYLDPGRSFALALVPNLDPRGSSARGMSLTLESQTRVSSPSMLQGRWRRVSASSQAERILHAPPSRGMTPCFGRQPDAAFSI